MEETATNLGAQTAANAAAAESPAASAAPVMQNFNNPAPAPAATPAESQAAPTGSDAAPSSFKLVVDPVTGERRVENLDTASSPEQPVPPADNSFLPQIPPPAAPYTEQEFLAAMQTGQIDEARIPDHLQINYTIYQQQMAQALAAQQRQQMAQTMQERQAAEVQRRFERERDMTSRATEAALKAIGMTPEDYADKASYGEEAEAVKAKFREAYNAEMDKMYREAVIKDMQEQAVRNEHALSMNEVGKFVQQAAQSEPHYKEIFAAMDVLYPQLNYTDSVKVQQVMEKMQNGTLTQKDLPILNAYYDIAKKAVYQRLNNVSTTPQPTGRARVPHTERPGRAYPSSAPRFDWSKLGAMSQGDRSQLVQQFVAANIQPSR